MKRTHLVLAILTVSLAIVPPAHARRGPTPLPGVPASGAPIAFAPLFAPTPLPRLSAAEELAVSRSSVGLLSVRLASGAVRMDLQGRFQDFAVASIGADGKLVVHCVEDADALRLLLAPATAPVTAPLEDR